jgi:hypothetical protein
MTSKVKRQVENENTELFQFALEFEGFVYDIEDGDFWTTFEITVNERYYDADVEKIDLIIKDVLEQEIISE